MVASRYDKVLTKYDWAEKHIDKFETAVDCFRYEHPHAIGRKYDTQTGEIVYYVESVPVIPDSLALMLGDALHNLRSTLDHLACALAAPTTDCSHTSFPIFDTAKDYGALSRTKIPSLRQGCYDILDRIQPYKDGWGHNLWKLHRLDIVDKHRLLLSIASVPVGSSQTPSEKAAFRSKQTVVGTASHYFRQLMYAAANPPVVPMQAGSELGRYPISEEYENMGFAFDVAINEPGILEGMPTFLFLRTVASEILGVISSFAPCL